MLCTDAGGSTATQVVHITITALANPGTINGTTNVCVAGTATLSATGSSGGTWTSSTLAVGSVSTSGVVRGLSAGTTTISYAVSNSCGPVYATAVVTVIAVPSAGSISGASTICGTASSALSDAVSSGAWSSTNTSAATVGTGGLVTGVAAGTTTISYTVTNSCGTAAATSVITVNAIASAGSVTGTTNVCVGATTALSSTGSSGGTWSSTNPAIGSVSTGGVVRGLSVGTTTISYGVTNLCGTVYASTIVTVNSTASAGSISGVSNVCGVASITLSDAIGAGVWSSTNTAAATVGTSGLVTGVAPGTTTISYAVTNGCGTTAATAVITVNPLVSAGSITGTATVCVGANTALSSTGSSGGTWTSTNPAVGSVSASGVVQGLSLGTTTISYGVSNSCGTSYASVIVTVNAIPSAGSISGASTVCGGASIPLSDVAGGGVWSSTNTAAATIGTGGLVTGVAAGNTTISYAVTNSCGTVAATVVITVNAVTSAGSVTGTANVCVAATTALSTTGSSGGTWTSSNPVVGSVSTGGVVQGLSLGTTTISYGVSNSCGTSYASVVVTVNAIPSAGSISGASTVCGGASITLSDLVAGGVWTSTSTANATVGTDGMVTGVAVGTTIISYTVSNGCGTAAATSIITVNAVASAGTISGASAVCSGASITLSDLTGGGVWSSTSTSIATIGTDGLVTGVAIGTTTISYTVTYTCGTVAATAVITVNAALAAGSITGTTNVCVAATTTLSTTGSAGGTWTSTNPAVGSVSVGGVVQGLSAGTTTISYGLSNSCGASYAFIVVTVNTAPDAGSISGASVVCSGGSLALSDITGGGVWSSTNTTVANIGTGGLLIGVAAGTTTISYTVTNSCGNAAATEIVTVNAAAAAGTITGASAVAIGSNISLSDVAIGGTWSASNTNATITGGVVLGVATGTVTISYSITNSCGTAVATKVVTVGTSTITSTVSSIVETQSYVCVGNIDLMMDFSPGGAWSITPVSVATISPTGYVYGVSAGTATVTYAIGASFATTVVTVYPVPAVITGSPSVCQGGGTTTLFDTTPGGTWSSALSSTASIGATGMVTGNNPGTVTMYYTIVSPGGCRAAVVVTVNPNPSAISGPLKVCTGSFIVLSDAVTGGAWSGSNAHASIDVFGNVSGLTAGTVNFTYTTGAGCYKTAAITVTQSPGPINGNLAVCEGAKTFLTDALTPAVSWTSGTTSVATITASGAVTGVLAGTTVITYTPSGLCTITAVVTVNTTPSITAILGASSVSHGGSGITLSDLSGGGVWSSSNTAILTVGSTTGHVTAIAAGGSANINYAITNGFGCVNSVSRLIGASAAPHTQGNSATTTVGSIVNISDEAMDGEWASSNDNIATVDNSGTVTGIASGNVSITHTVITREGNAYVTTTDVAVTTLPIEVSLLPNPNKGSFIVKGTLGCKADSVISMEITDMLGQVIYSKTTTAASGLFYEEVQLNRTLANGMYLLKLHSGSENKTLHFVIE